MHSGPILRVAMTTLNGQRAVGGLAPLLEELEEGSALFASALRRRGVEDVSFRVYRV